ERRDGTAVSIHDRHSKRLPLSVDPSTVGGAALAAAGDSYPPSRREDAQRVPISTSRRNSCHYLHRSNRRFQIGLPVTLQLRCHSAPKSDTRRVAQIEHDASV